MNPTTLVFLGLAVVWAIVLLPEVARKFSGRRRSDTIRSFNEQLSVLDRSGRSGAGDGSNVVSLRPGRPPAAAPAPVVVPASVRRRRQEVITVLGAAAMLTLLCTVAFGGPFLVLHLLADVLLVTYLVLVNQANQAAARSAVPAHRASLGHGPTRRVGADQGLRTATVGRAAPVRRVAN